MLYDLPLSKKLNNIITKSNKITYQKNLEKYFSQGKTNITVEDKYIINSKNVNLLVNENQFFSNENTTVEDLENNFYTAEKFRYQIKKKLFRGNRVFLNTNNNDEYYKILYDGEYWFANKQDVYGGS